MEGWWSRIWIIQSCPEEEVEWHMLHRGNREGKRLRDKRIRLFKGSQMNQVNVEGLSVTGLGHKIHRTTELLAILNDIRSIIGLRRKTCH